MDILQVGSHTLQVKQLKQADLVQLSSWIEGEKWPLTLEDLQLYYSLEAQSFHAAYTDEDKLVGHVYFKVMNKTTAHIDFVLVDRSHRGTGIGTALLKQVLGMYPGYNVTLISAAGTDKLYRQLGFQETGQTVQVICRILPRLSDNFGLLSINIKIADEDDESEVSSYIKQVTSYDIAPLVSARISHPKTTCFIAKPLPNMAGNGQEVPIVGVMMVTDTTDAYMRVSAWLANNDSTAKYLLEHSVTYLRPKKPYRIVFPTSNMKNVMTAIKDILPVSVENLSVAEACMSLTGQIPGVQWEKCYGAFEAAKFCLV